MLASRDEVRSRRARIGRPSRRIARRSCDPIRERKLLRAAQRGDRGARSRLVEHHLGLVRAIAWRYRDCGLSVDDLVQEGSIGLVEAIDNYDFNRVLRSSRTRASASAERFAAL